ncbi:MAG TPA: right-handed parallel beta-helix repeat-containing protein [Pirellulales bacterium]|nr:right-handed parallel beta-helix repeat-containing protein [Pirellulales bacterium]
MTINLGARYVALFAILATVPMAIDTRIAAAATVYVDNAVGDDRHEGAQPSSIDGDGPVRTLRRALQVCRAGDRVLLANTGEPYRETISLSTAAHCGNALSPFIIDGQGATLEGTEAVPRDAWENERGPVFRFRPPRTSYQQLFLDGKPATQRKMLAGETHFPKLQPLEWYRRGASIYFCVDSDKLPRDYDLAYSARQTGITIYHVHDVVITNLVVQGFRLDGVNVNDGVVDCELLDVTSRGNGRSGVTIAGSSKARLEGCVIGDNGEEQLLVEGTSSTLVEQCELIANTAPAVTNRGARLDIRTAPSEKK